jgi:hypothetical protein
MIDIKRETATKPQKGTKSIGARVTEVRYAQVLQFANDAGMNMSDWLNKIIDRHELYIELKPIIIGALEFKIRNTTIGINTLSQRKEMQKIVDILKRL